MDELQAVRQALQAGDKSTARQLLQPILAESPSADTWVLAAFASDTPQEVLQNVQRALALDPAHPQATSMMSDIQAMLAQSQVATPTPSVTPEVEPYLDIPTQSQPVVKPPKRETPKGEGTYQMQWKCGTCGTDKLLGLTHRFCPNCGTPQRPDWRYFPDDADKVAVEDHVFVGKDLTCRFCGELNSASSKFCENCGSSLEGAEQASTLADEVAAGGVGFGSSGPRDTTKEKFDAEMERVGVTKKKNGTGGLTPQTIGIIGVVALVIIGALVALFWKQEAQALVIGHAWERTVHIDEYRNFSTRSWRDSPPVGDNVSMQFGSCSQEVRSYRQVADGQTCSTVRVDNGDGTFSQREQCTTKYRQEPVYDDMCTWTGQRWESSRQVQTKGQSLADTPTWGQVTLRCANQRTIGCEREESRTESYWVDFRNTADTQIVYRCDFPQNQWETIRIESVWTVQVRVVDKSAADCGSLQPVQ